MADTEYVGSREKARNGYGQNGYQGPSSDLPGQSTRADRDFGLPTDPSTETGDWQTRRVSAEPYKTTPTMRSRSGEGGKIPDANVRRATKQAAPGSFQR
jgi:hypothetical protein